MKNKRELGGKSNPNYRHGKSGSTELYAWGSMIARCYRKTSDRFIRYGGRGITVCDRWLNENGFKNFLEDMGEKPSKDHSLGRIDNDANYTPENCRWETAKQQRSNRSDNHLITFRGETLPAFQWAKKTGIPSNVIRPRILKYGWTVERALTTPIPKKGKHP